MEEVFGFLLDFLLEFVLEVISGVALVAIGPLFAGRNRARRRLEKIRQYRTKHIPSNFATFRRIVESK